MADATFDNLFVNNNLGIGTTEPSARLHILTPTGISNKVFVENIGGSLLKISTEATGAIIGTENAFPLSIQTNGVPRISINGTGNISITEPLTVTANVSIGTDTTPANLQVKGSVTGPLTVQNNLRVTGGTITPAVGNSENAGILFPKNPGSGTGDAAWMRYYPRTGEATTFEIGTSNESNDHIALMASGNVGIGTIEPQGKLDVRGDIRAGNSDIYFTKTDHNHTGIGNTSGFAAIENAANFEALMILGRAGTSKGRAVKLWDYLQVNGDLDVTGNINGRVAGIGIAVTTGLTHGQNIPIPAGFSKAECVFMAFIKFANFPADEQVIFNCYADKDGKVFGTPEGKVIATGVAIAKRGGW